MSMGLYKTSKRSSEPFYLYGCSPIVTKTQIFTRTTTFSTRGGKFFKSESFGRVKLLRKQFLKPNNNKKNPPYMKTKQTQFRINKLGKVIVKVKISHASLHHEYEHLS